MAICANVEAQEKSTPVTAKPTAEIQQLIEDLGSTDFKTKQAAFIALERAGDQAIEPLREALKDGSLERKVLIRSLLPKLERNSFVVRVADLQKNPIPEVAATFPEWSRFSEMVGSDESSIQLYCRLLAAEPALFKAAENAVDEVPDRLEARAAALRKSTVKAPVMLEQFSVDSFSALLFFAGMKKSDGEPVYRLPGGSSSNISGMLNYSEFLKAVRAPDGTGYRKLAGRYILRKRITPDMPVHFARAVPMPEGIALARSVLRDRRRKNISRWYSGLYAMVLIREQGTAADIPLLESLFDDRGVLFGVPNQVQQLRRQIETELAAIDKLLVEGRNEEAARQRHNLHNLRTRLAEAETKVAYAVYNGDVALAVAFVLRGEDPRDFGFPALDPETLPFRLSSETTGFPSENDRRNAHDLYDCITDGLR